MRRLLLLLLLLLLLHQIDLPVAAVVVVVPQPDLYHWHTLVWNELLLFSPLIDLIDFTDILSRF